MPSLPRIRRTRPRGGVDVARALSRASTKSAARGLTWVHLETTDADVVAGARRALRLARARPRGRPLEAAAAEDRRVPELPLHRPPLPGLRQGDPAAERRRAGPLPRAGLPGHAAEHRAAARLAPLPRCRGRREPARRPVRQGLGLPALPRPRRPVRLLLPDPRQDRAQARPDRGRDVRGALRGDRPRHLQRQAGDHLLPQDHQARALDAAPARAPRRRATCPRSSSSTSTTSSTPPSGSGTCSTTTRRSSRRSRTRTSPSSRTARTTSSACSRSSASRAAADADREHLRHERRLPGRGHPRGVLDHPRRMLVDAASRSSASSATSAGSDLSGPTIGVGPASDPSRQSSTSPCRRG